MGDNQPSSVAALPGWTRPEPMPRVTFGIIVLNGEPFTRYCLRALYPFAHEIIVVEGGHEDTCAVATPDGHSLDGTLDALEQFCAEEDPQGKVTVVTRDGFWPKKDEIGRCRTAQSRAYAERATGDYLWQVDIDEFYRVEDIRRVLEMLVCEPEITSVSFHGRNFWGSPGIEVQGWALQRGLHDYDRLFKWGPEYRYVTHEPPTVADAAGRDLRTLKWIRASEMARRGVHMYHYALLFPWQVEQKTRLYEDENTEAYAGIKGWAESSYFRLGHPYRVYHMRHLGAFSWLKRYQGEHPAEVQRMMDDIGSGRVQAALRDNRDAYRMLDSWWYGPGAMALACLGRVDCGRLQHFLRRLTHAPRWIESQLRSGRPHA